MQVAPAGKVVSPLVVRETAAPPTRLPLASLTVVVAVEVETPSAAMVAGLRATVTAAGAVAVSVRVAVPDFALAVAVIVSWSAVTDALTVTEHVPEALVVQVAPAGKVVTPLVVKETTAPPTRLPLASLTVVVAVEGGDAVRRQIGRGSGQRSLRPGRWPFR